MLTRQKRSRDDGENDGSAAAVAPAATPPVKAKRALAKLADYNPLNEKFTTPSSSKRIPHKPKLLINEINNNKNDNGGGSGSPASSLGNLSSSSTKGKSSFWTYFIILFIYSN